MRHRANETAKRATPQRRQEAMRDRCTATPLTGGRCELPAGHDGKHRKTSWPDGSDGEPFVFEWSDESQTELLRRFEERTGRW